MGSLRGHREVTERSLTHRSAALHVQQSVVLNLRSKFWFDTAHVRQHAAMFCTSVTKTRITTPCHPREVRVRESEAKGHHGSVGVKSVGPARVGATWARCRVGLWWCDQARDSTADRWLVGCAALAVFLIDFGDDCERGRRHHVLVEVFERLKKKCAATRDKPSSKTMKRNHNFQFPID
jgi:hypothetical protein